MRRDDKIYQEAAALWRELFRDPPPAKADGPTLLELIMQRLPNTRYERLRTLRPSTGVVMPKRA
jgi:hypothetical protein